jgi:hypothetical protein
LVTDLRKRERIAIVAEIAKDCQDCIFGELFNLGDVWQILAVLAILTRDGVQDRFDTIKFALIIVPTP